MDTAWIWRAAVLTYLSATVLRASIFGDVLPDMVWQIAQFGPVLMALTMGILLRPRLTVASTPLRVLYLSVGGFLAVSLASVAVSVDRMNSLFQWTINVLMILFIGWNAQTRWRDDATSIRNDLKLITVFFSTVQSLGFLVWLVDRDLAMGPYVRFVGLFNNANYTGMISSLALMFLLGFALTSGSLRSKLIYGVLMAPVLAALIMSGSRAAGIATVVGLALLIGAVVPRRAIRVLTTATAIAIALVIVLLPTQEIRDSIAGVAVDPPPVTGSSELVDGGSGAGGSLGDEVDAGESSHPDSRDPYDALNGRSSGRLELYSGAIQGWLDAPILGSGFRTAPTVMNGLETHNLPLQVLLETGGLGCLTFIGVIWAIVLRFKYGSIDRALAVAVLTIAILEFSESSMLGWGGPTAFVFWTTIFAFFYAPSWNLGGMSGRAAMYAGAPCSRM